jgi:hypothetical protein
LWPISRRGAVKVPALVKVTVTVSVNSFTLRQRALMTKQPLAPANTYTTPDPNFDLDIKNHHESTG